MTTWEKEIGAITLFVEDLEKSKAFYQDIFELEPMFTEDDGAAFRLKNLYFFLTKSSAAPNMIAPAVAGAPGNGPRHVFAIIVPDVDGVCAELEAKGVKLINGPDDRDWGMRTANFADPDGYVWEIAQELGEAAESAPAGS
jgi:lactoylglutathione lyase